MPLSTAEVEYERDKVKPIGNYYNDTLLRQSKVNLETFQWGQKVFTQTINPCLYSFIYCKILTHHKIRRSEIILMADPGYMGNQ
jgi:hypothetical protein